MSDDPYAILGVQKSATPEDIRKAYRKLAKRYHPDLNPGDSAAEAQFKAVSAAYDLLGDPDKRARFDSGEIDASGQERPQQRFYRDFADQEGFQRYTSTAGFRDFSEFGDLFGDLFGRAGGQAGGTAGAGGRAAFGFGGFQARGRDVQYALEVDFLEAVKGARKRITLPEGGSLDLTIPAGLEDGQVLRLRGKGQPGPKGTEPGDALVSVRVRPHPVFERKGRDLHMELPVRFDEAVLGAKVPVPTPTGTVTLTLPKGASGGRILRLRGKGVPDAKTGRHGDLLVRLRIVLPAAVDAELEALARRWAEKHAFDPRKTLEEATS